MYRAGSYKKLIAVNTWSVKEETLSSRLKDRAF